MKEDSIFRDHVGDTPRMRIVQYLMEGRGFDYTLTDLLSAGVSWGTLNSLVSKLLELGAVVKTRKIVESHSLQNKSRERCRQAINGVV